MTGTSYADGYEAVFANPAGLAHARKSGFFLGPHAAAYRLSLDQERFGLDPVRGLSIGFHLPLPFGDVLEDRLVLGGAFFTSLDVLLQGTVAFSEVPRFTVLDRGQSLGIMLAVGIDLPEVLEGLSFGFGMAALADVTGELDVFLDQSATFQSVVENQLQATFAPLVGLRLRRDAWGVGLTYRHKLASRFALEIRTADLPVEIPVLQVGGIGLYDPPTLIGEGFWRPIRGLRLIANLTTRFWSRFPGEQATTTDSSFLAPAPGFRTTVSPRVAVEGTLRHGTVEGSLRAGYAFEPTPAPRADDRPARTADGEEVPALPVPYRLLDNARHVLTAGLGVGADLTDKVRLISDVYGQVHVLVPRTHSIGQSVESPEPMRTKGTIWVGGWTVGLEY